MARIDAWGVRRLPTKRRVFRDSNELSDSGGRGLEFPPKTRLSVHSG